MPPGFTVNSGRRSFVDELGRDTLGAHGLDDSLGLPTLEILLSPLDVVSMSYRVSSDDEGGLGLDSFSGWDRLSVGRTMSKNPSMTKKSPDTIFGSSPQSIGRYYAPISRSPAFAK
jgi:hypothetical protein